MGLDGVGNFDLVDFDGSGLLADLERQEGPASGWAVVDGLGHLRLVAPDEDGLIGATHDFQTSLFIKSIVLLVLPGFHH